MPHAAVRATRAIVVLAMPEIAEIPRFATG